MKWINRPCLPLDYQRERPRQEKIKIYKYKDVKHCHCRECLQCTMFRPNFWQNLKVCAWTVLPITQQRYTQHLTRIAVASSCLNATHLWHWSHTTNFGLVCVQIWLPDAAHVFRIQHLQCLDLLLSALPMKNETRKTSSSMLLMHAWPLCFSILLTQLSH